LILWRISNYADLNGTGGLLHSGRWHHRGRPVVYLAESAAGALLEVLVHLEVATSTALPKSYRLLEVKLPDDASSIDAPVRMGPHWLTWKSQIERTRRLGDVWLASGDSLLLRVPSAVVGRSFNRLLNPQHAEARRCRIVSVSEWPFDERLKP
jgi:RES domain-containing protein